MKVWRSMVNIIKPNKNWKEIKASEMALKQIQLEWMKYWKDFEANKIELKRMQLNRMG